MNVTDWTIRARSTFALGAILLLVALLAGTSLWELQITNTAGQELAANWLPSIKLLGEMKFRQTSARSALIARVVLADSPEEAKKQLEGVLKIRKAYDDAAKNYETSLISSPEERALWDKAKEAPVIYRKQADAGIDAILSGTTLRDKN